MADGKLQIADVQISRRARLIFERRFRHRGNSCLSILAMPSSLLYQAMPVLQLSKNPQWRKRRKVK